METNSQSSSIASGIRWSAVGQVLGQIIRFASSVVMARLLSPEDFGYFGMALVITGFLGIFQSLGSIGIIVQKQEIASALLDSLHVVNIFMGFILAGLLAASGSWIATLYDDQVVVSVARVLGLTFIASSFGIVPLALLNRNMLFDRIVLIEITATVCQVVVGILLAALGWGVWSLVCGNLANSVVLTVLCFASCSQRLRWRFDWSEIQSVARFGLSLTGNHVVDHWISYADKFLIGRYFKAATLGYYSLAWSLYSLPVQSVTGLVNRVLFPAFSRLHQDEAALRRVVLRAVGGLAFVTFPIMIGLILTAEPLVLAVYGVQWVPAIPLIIILAPVGILQAMTGINSNVLLAKGRSDWLLWWNLGSGAFTIISFFCGLPWGVVGVAAAYGIAMLPLSFLSCVIAFHLIKIPLVELFVTVRPYAVASAVMAASVLVCRQVLEHWGYALVPVLTISILAAVIVYIAIVLLVQPAALHDYLWMFPARLKTTKMWAKLFTGDARL
jgi:lipopolysaccharide exporter